MTGQEAFAHYLRDLGVLLEEKALDAKLERDASAGADDEAYALGRLMAYHEVVSLMQSQAEAFGLNLADIGLDKIDPERDLS